MKICFWTKSLMSIALITLTSAGAYSQAAPANNTAFVNNLMPQPASLTASTGSLVLTPDFRAVAVNAGMTLHLKQLAGRNAHHIAEAAFKAFGRALDAATRLDARIQGVPSTKGVL